MKRRLIVGVSGASGIVYAERMLTVLRDNDVETHLVVSKSAELARVHETNLSGTDLRSLADYQHAFADVAAPISSGSFKTDGMVIIPCSIRTLSEIAWGMTSSLLTRAADVVLKERRRLVLVVRETPLHAGHLKSMLAATEAGAIIAPPVPAFYPHPKSIDDIVAHTVGRVLDLFGIESSGTRRWGESDEGDEHETPQEPA